MGLNTATVDSTLQWPCSVDSTQLLRIAHCNDRAQWDLTQLLWTVHCNDRAQWTQHSYCGLYTAMNVLNGLNKATEERTLQ
jgi:hypothetical protein